MFDELPRVKVPVLDRQARLVFGGKLLPEAKLLRKVSHFREVRLVLQRVRHVGVALVACPRPALAHLVLGPLRGELADRFGQLRLNSGFAQVLLSVGGLLLWRGCSAFRRLRCWHGRAGHVRGATGWCRGLGRWGQHGIDQGRVALAVVVLGIVVNELPV
ncbi:hypothetical protein FQZ97_741330 [compost metagenome]